MDSDDDPSSLAWLWVIEALFTVKQISISTLQGLIDAAPVGNDKFSEVSKELVALRCLEELSTRMVDPGASSTFHSSVGFDFSQRCEDALLQALGEIPLSNLKMAGGELLKSDVYPFIKHKRAGTFKCHLEQLREMILEGTHPHTDYLRERSGLFPQNSSYRVLVNDVKCDNHSDKDAENSTDADNMVAKENSVSLILENGNKSSKEHLLDYNSSPSKSKRRRVSTADVHLTKHHHEKQVCVNERDDFFRDSKRIKCYASPSFEPEKVEPVSQHGQEVSEHLTERILLVSEQGEHHVDSKKMENLGDGSSEDTHNRCTASKLCHSNSHIEVFHDESNIPFNDTLVPHHTFGGENSQKLMIEPIPHVALPDEIQHKISGSKPWSKHESGDFVYQGEKINREMKKQAEQNLCLKCNEGEQLLSCDANLVQPVVPECCLEITSTIIPQHTSVAEPCNNTSMDENKDNSHHSIPRNDANAKEVRHTINLHQPKQTEPDITSLYLSPKPAASDKTIVDMVNGCRAEFSCDSDGNHNEKNYVEAIKHEFLHSHSTVDQDFSAMTESTEQNLCMKCNEGGKLLACKTTTCPLVMHKNCLGASAQLDANGNFVCPFCAYSHAISEYLEAKKKVSLARKELTIFVSKGKQNYTAELVREFHRQEHSFLGKNLTGGVEENEVPTDHLDGHVGDKFTSEKTNIAPVNQSNVGEDVPLEMAKQHIIDGTREPVHAHNSGKEEISENECEKHSISRYSMRFRNHKTQSKSQASPVFLGNQLRRRNVPWTAEEEELIREGVQKFGFDDPHKWKKILKFGSHVFEKVGKRRTPIDLKDKWKNMCKAHSKSE